MLEEFIRDNIVIGSSLDAWEYAYSNNYPIISTGAYSPCILNEEEYVYYTKLVVAMGLMGLAPCVNEVKKIEVTHKETPVVRIYSDSELLFTILVQDKIHVFNDDALEINDINFEKQSSDNRIYDIIYFFYFVPRKAISEKLLQNTECIEGIEDYEITELVYREEKRYIFRIHMKAPRCQVFDFENGKEATKQFLEHKYKTTMKNYHCDTFIRPENLEVVQNIDYLIFHTEFVSNDSLFEASYNTPLWRVYKHLFESYSLYKYYVNIEQKEKEMYEKVLSSKIKQKATTINRFDL